MLLLIALIRGITQVLIYLLIARAIFSWVSIRPGGTAYNINQMIKGLTEPIILPCRKIMKNFNTGMLDFSIFLAIILVMVISDIIIKILRLLA